MFLVYKILVKCILGDVVVSWHEQRLSCNKPFFCADIDLEHLHYETYILGQSQLKVQLYDLSTNLYES